MSEYLSSQELHQLTGHARTTQQSAWLKFRGIPFKQDAQQSFPQNGYFGHASRISLASFACWSACPASA